MKTLKLISAITGLALSASANAALIDNGTFTTDDITGLDWLDLSITDSQAYNSAVSLNPGWRHASYTEVQTLFSSSFDGAYDTSNGGGISTLGSGYTDQAADMATFISLFGETDTDMSIGFVADLYGDLRWTGVDAYNIHLPSTFATYNDSADSGHSQAGIFMVRTSVVPVPAAVWLFGSGLIGLVGFARRKKA